VLSFNDLLVLAGIDPAGVRLVRHQDNRVRPGRLYEAWRNDRDAFEAYQSVQRKARFQVGDLVASFVVTEARKTVFVGLYRVEGVRTVPDGSFDELTRHDMSGQSKFDLQLMEQLADYRDRVVIEWGAAGRVWVQRAGTNRSRSSRSLSSTSPSFRASGTSSALSMTCRRFRTAGSKSFAASRACTCLWTSTPASSTSAPRRAQRACWVAG
jgi:hypothetical protein